ncbi:acyl-CoA dehydrogenase family protein [Chitinimonas arctica]|nr:acyl-CoA dehydrogenase family protein [Chitinimonas arctica]
MSLNRITTMEQLEVQLGDPAVLDGSLHFVLSHEYDEAERFPQAHIETLRTLGCFQYFIPARLGGQLAEFEQLALLCRVIARRDLSTAIAFGQTFLGALPVWLAGNTQQQETLAAQLREGGLGCLALTEKAHGSDIFATELMARQSGEHLYLTGNKWLINNANKGVSVTVLAKRLPPGGSPELCLLYLPKADLNPRHWQATGKIRTHGIRGADISGLEFRDCKVDPNSLLKSTEPALFTVLKGLQISRILCAGFSLGALDSLFRTTLGFARERVLYARGMLEIPAVRANLAQCYSRILVADLVNQLGCRAISQLPTQLSLYSAIVKYLVPTEAEQIGQQLSVTLGARHYLRDEYQFGMFQKFLRDNQVVSLFDGSTQINLGLIASQLNALSANLLSRQAASADRDALNQVVALFRIGESCSGFPEQAQLALNNGGQDAVMAAFLQLMADPDATSFSPETRALTVQLQTSLLQLLREIHGLAQPPSAAINSACYLELAKRYSRLFSGACAVLAWHCNDASQAAEFASPAILQEYLRYLLAVPLTPACAARHGEIIDMAVAKVDQRYLLSFNAMHIQS